MLEWFLLIISNNILWPDLQTFWVETIHAMLLIKRRSGDAQCLITNFMIRSSEAAIPGCSLEKILQHLFLI